MSSEIKKYYDKLAQNYDENRFGNSYGQYVDAQERKILNYFFKRHQFKKILDLGCGTGRLLNFATHGVDFSLEMLKIAQEKFPNKVLKEGTTNSLPFKNHFFQCIFCFHVMMHQEEKSVEEFLNESHKKLDENGILIFDYISSKRRKERSEQNNWHANNSFTDKKMMELISKKWNLKEKYGVLLFPIHRFPIGLRNLILPLDIFLCNTLLKKWASYTVLILEKNK